MERLNDSGMQWGGAGKMVLSSKNPRPIETRSRKMGKEHPQSCLVVVLAEGSQEVQRGQMGALGARRLELAVEG